jgi:hypothetical protein
VEQKLAQLDVDIPTVATRQREVRAMAAAQYQFYTAVGDAENAASVHGWAAERLTALQTQQRRWAAERASYAEGANASPRPADALPVEAPAISRVRPIAGPWPATQEAIEARMVEQREKQARLTSQMAALQQDADASERAAMEERQRDIAAQLAAYDLQQTLLRDAEGGQRG